jgi:hypothetical protein
MRSTLLPQASTSGAMVTAAVDLQYLADSLINMYLEYGTCGMHCPAALCLCRRDTPCRVPAIPRDTRGRPRGRALSPSRADVPVDSS